MSNENITVADLKPVCKKLRLGAVYEELVHSLEDPKTLTMSHTEWLHDLLSAELVRREENRLNRRLREANIRHKEACMADIDFDTPRGLNRAQIMSLGNCDWIRSHQNCIITGKTGCGKSWLAGAFANAACRQGLTVRFVRVPLFLKEFSAQRKLGLEFNRQLRELRRIDLLVLDDWGMGAMDAENRSDLLEIIEDRCGVGSTLITSVLPVKVWAQYINDATYADSILDRLVRNSHRIKVEGESMRGLKCYGAVSEEKEE